MMVNELIKGCLLCEKQNPRFAYLAPTYKQAKNIAWDYLKHYSRAIPGIKVNESELRVDYPNRGRIQVLGADNPDSLRGAYYDGVVLDEYAQIRPSLYSEVIRPALSDRKGWACFIGTPKGKNHFYDMAMLAQQEENWCYAEHKASMTGYVDEGELEDAKKVMDPDEYAQEYECSWEAYLKGAFYTEQLKAVKDDGRICRNIYDKSLPVNTAWDIGFKDDTSIIFYQVFGKEIRIVDALSKSGLTIPDYVKILREKGYEYGEHHFPHDARIKRLTDGKSVVDVAREHGLTVRNTPGGLTQQDGINQVRQVLQHCWFEEENTKELIEALSMYHREWDDKKQMFRENPLHDWTSHYADAFRYMAISLPKNHAISPKYQPGRPVYQQPKKKKSVFSSVRFK